MDDLGPNLSLPADLQNQAEVTRDPSLVAVVALCCVLSMAGSSLIALSYALIAEIRTTSRAILVHLSAADFGVACANLVGATVYFHGYFRLNDCDGLAVPNPVCTVVNGFCTTQAFLAGYFTLASVLWTLGLAVYIHALVTTVQPTRIPVYVVRFLYLFCWGMPLLVTVWLLQTDRLGYSPNGGAGWCSLKFAGSERQGEQVFVVVFGNDLWIYSAFLMITVLYLSSHYHILRTIKLVGAMHLNDSSISAILRAEQKFLVIPFAFLLLRIGSILTVMMYVYLGDPPSRKYSTALHYIAGIGDSAQGIVNAVLFCVFTQKVRRKLYECGIKQVVSRIATAVKRRRNGATCREQDPISLRDELCKTV